MIFIVRLFPEITIKSSPVRKRLTKHLTENLRILGRRLHPKMSVASDWDKLEVRVPSDDALLQQQFIDLLGSTPGIANFSVVKVFPFVTMHDIYEHTLDEWGEELTGKTFCVRVRRTGRHEFKSIDAERYIGGGLNQNTDSAGVKLKKPDIEIHVEVKDDQCFIVSAKHQGVGGFPVGTQESVLSLVSGGFDSTVASYMMIRRGMRTHFCFFNLGGRAHEVGVKEIAFYLWNRFGSTHKVRFITVPFEGVVAEILDKIDPSNMGVVLKRMMLRAAERVAEKGGIQALVTGEAIAQVSSQTIPNLVVIDSVTKMLVLRPLIAVDKPDIIRQAREIGAEDFSANIPEYCGVISVKPSAKVNPEKLEQQEQQFDMGVLETALAQSSVQAIDQVMASINTQSTDELLTLNVPADSDVVIDVRHPTEVEMRPLQLPHGASIAIPFYKLSSEFPLLDAECRYLLYCDKGVMSALHAAHLADDGFANVGVYRPQP
jgi:[ThiS-adenylate] sulfurtransferase